MNPTDIVWASCRVLKGLDGDAPIEYRIGECLRRFNARVGQSNDYLNLAKRLQTQYATQLMDDKLRLTSTYTAKPWARRIVDGLKKSPGTLDALGNMWVPAFRLFVPPVTYNILQPIGECIVTWNNTTLTEGKVHGDVAEYRRMRKADGTAYRLVRDILRRWGLTYNHTTLIDRLTTAYVPK